jgi:hypothetical protein
VILSATKLSGRPARARHALHKSVVEIDMTRPKIPRSDLPNNPLRENPYNHGHLRHLFCLLERELEGAGIARRAKRRSGAILGALGAQSWGGRGRVSGSVLLGQGVGGGG